jgi:hypothetical protein
MTEAMRVHIPTGISPKHWFVLVHTKHGNAARESEMYNSGLPRMLNATGRWSSHPSEQVPVLVWETRQEAEAAAETARRSKGREAVKAQSISGSVLEMGKNLRRYTPEDAPALVGYRDYGPTARKKAEDMRIKVLAYAGRLVGDALGNAQLVARAKKLASRTGSGAAEHLTGRAGSETARSIIKEDNEPDDLITREVVAQALVLAEVINSARLNRGSLRPFPR